MDSSNKYLSADERKAVTVEAVIELAGERNPSEITTAAIAERMGLTQGAIFRHFPNKDAIMQAVMQWTSDHLMLHIIRAGKEKDSPSVKLESIFAAHVSFIMKHPGIPRILFAELQHSKDTFTKKTVQNLIRKYSGYIQCLIEDGKSAGELDPDLDNDAVATLFIGMIQGLVVQSLISGDVTLIGRDAPKVYEIFQQGIGRKL
jgi:AcrR family transcriptional regulator